FFFGFDVIVERYAGPWLSCALPLGFLLLGALVVLWLHALRQRAISAMVLGGMFFVGYRLFATVNGFGLFKLAMFALPFALVEFARVVDFRGGRWLLGAVLLVLVPIGVAGSIRYTAASLAGAKSLVGEVFDASRSLGRIPPAGAAAVWSDVDSSPVAKLLMLERRHPGPLFLSQSFLGGYVRSGAAPWPDWAYRFRPGPRFDTAASSRLVEGFKHEVYVPASVNGLDFLRQPATEGAAGQGDIPVVTSQGELRAFNQLEPRPGERSDGLFAWAPFRGLENHLVFVNSRQGQHYYLGDDGQISVYKPEPDVYDPRGHFFVIGRHLLFRVLNPSATVRIRLSLTDSVLGQGRTALPAEARAKGTGPSPVPFGLVGAGSANVVSPPLQPFHLAGADYVALDLGRPTIPIGLPAEGLEGIYNRSVSLDSRSGVAYCRDISALSEERYAARPPLSRLSRFPADLVGPHAPEYSGIYEDGWVSGHAFVRLGPVQAGSRVSGLMQRPTLPGVAPLPRRVTLLLDGVPQFTREIPPGDFRWEATCPRPAECVKIELVFDGIDTLPAPDLRPAAALLTFVQIQPAP
ncbi:MAG: hypothetical protein JSR48_03020, partial [Verrucomicrobia bacterium]|nr:hypothetical protein [Verrucomicrobiota bacterium]